MITYFVYTIREMRVVKQTNQLRVFYYCLAIAILLALFLMDMTLVERAVIYSHGAYVGTATEHPPHLQIASTFEYRYVDYSPLCISLNLTFT